MTRSTRDLSVDALVVGARVAGAATATWLARAGLRVLAIDRGPEGSDTLSTHAMMRGGVLQLARLGVLDRVIAAGTPAITTTTFHYGDEVLPIAMSPKFGVDALRAPRRTVLDPVLVEAAREAGAEVRHGWHLETLTRDATGRVTGAGIAARTGETVRVRSGIVVGADGRGSPVAKAVRAPVAHAGFHSSGTTYRLVAGLPQVGYQWYYRPGVAVGVIPTNGGENVVFASTSTERFQLERSRGLEAHFLGTLAEAAPDLAPAVRASACGPIRAFAGEPGYLRRAAGPGWALAGDAGGFRDPITSHGMSDALRDAEWLARAIVRGTDAALADYERARDAVALEIMRLSDAVAGFAWNLGQLKDLHLLLSRRMTAAVAATIAAGDPPGAGMRPVAGRGPVTGEAARQSA